MSIATQQVVLHTNKGDITLNVFGNHAPKTVANFVELAEGSREFIDPQTKEKVTRPFYNGLGFHRIIPQFMIQGGCPLGTGTGGPGYVFDDEIHPELQFDRPYILAMANAGIQMGRGTNGSQFFITTVPTPWLNGKHTIFGEVADDESKKVVDALEAAPTGMMDRPKEPLVIETVEVLPKA
ncbi:peptidylprolyl isomerase [Brevibacterium samyangense]|uniref:Peptidyl-prolyl cis-trans isomerase n=1 Tax=Brevibacterium samyangense TaxID=366888 RepID=A0ABN2T411_9MICO